MDHDQALREHLVKLLRGGEAHVTFEDAIAKMPFEMQGKTPAGAEHSPWQLLEHVRIAQWDILEFSRNARHVSPKFPEGYWPKTAAPVDEDGWGKSVNLFEHDLDAMCALVQTADLFEKIPHGDGQTVLRQALLTADHNAYHLGQLVLVRRLLGAWG
jgi:hypothetical protein